MKKVLVMAKKKVIKKTDKPKKDYKVGKGKLDPDKQIKKR